MAGEQELRETLRGLLAFGSVNSLTPEGAEELRLWPPKLATALAERWPSGLRAADVVLLPKPGGSIDEPLQRRPITLLPLVHRLWARLRLPVVDAWRSGWGLVVAEAPGGPDGQAWGLAWDLACSEALGQDLCGMAVDMTKCYDSAQRAIRCSDAR